MNFPLRYLAPLAVVAMLPACGVQQSFESASAEVKRFHAALDAGRWEQVWQAADPDLRKTTGREQFRRLFEAVHRKLGKVKETKQVGWNANAGTGGSTVTLTMETTFERGSGTEQIVYRKGEGDRLALLSYDIQSQAMMLN